MPRIKNVQRNTSKVVSPIRRDYRARQMNMNKNDDNDDIDEETINNEVSQEESDTFNSADNTYGDNTANQDNSFAQETDDASSSNENIKSPINVDITQGARRLLQRLPLSVKLAILGGILGIIVIVLLISIFAGIFQSFGIMEFSEEQDTTAADYQKEYEEYWGEVCAGDCDDETQEMLEGQQDFYKKLNDQNLSEHQKHMVITTAYYGYDNDEFKGDTNDDAVTLSESETDSDMDIDYEVGMVKKLSKAAKKGDSTFYSWLKKKDYLTKKPVYGSFLQKHNNDSDAAKDEMIEEIKQIIDEYEGKSNISSNGMRVSYNTFFWPIGSSEITDVNGVKFADGEPAVVKTEFTDATDFGPRQAFKTDNGNWSSSYHDGIDVGAAEGTPLIASFDGTVTAVQTSTPGSGYGNYVAITSKDGSLEFLYGHMQRVEDGIKVGDAVKQGQVIGYVGSTGNVTGPHLHLRAHLNGQPVDPLNYVDGADPRPKGAISVSGDGNVQTVCLYLKELGYSDKAIAAMVTVWTYESVGCNPTIVNPNSGAYGLAQWLGTRKTCVYNMLGNQIGDLVAQLNHAQMELNNELPQDVPGCQGLYYKNIENYLRTSNDDVTTMMLYFCNRYEAPGESYCSAPDRYLAFLPDAIDMVNAGCNGTVGGYS